MKPRLSPRWSVRASPRRIAVVAAAVALVPAAPAHAKYEDIISDFLAAETDCEVAYLSQVVERERDGYPHVRAKVHCEDGRTYDVEWDAESNTFDYARCGEQPAC